MEAEYPFHTAFLILVIAIVAIRMYFSGYADAASGVTQNTEGEGAYKFIRIAVALPLGLAFFAYMISPTLMAWSQLDMSPGIRWWGVPIGIIAIAMLVWVHRHLSRNFTGTVQIRPGGGVIQTGPYAYVRHPMYWNFVLLDVAFFLLTANWLLAGAFFALILVLVFVRLPVEEAALRTAYGAEYEAYAKRVGKLFPKMFRNKK